MQRKKLKLAKLASKRLAPKKFAHVRHKFLYRWFDSAGRPHVISAWARVRNSTSTVVLTIKPEHVEKSISLRGVGDTANCAMAVCANDHASSFPHPVEGHIDWTYTRAFVVSKTDSRGLPAECVVYDHADTIARMNDSLGGQRKLLKLLNDDGPRQIELRPKRIRSEVGRYGGSARTKTGARSVERRLMGGKLRYATARLASEQVET